MKQFIYAIGRQTDDPSGLSYKTFASVSKAPARSAWRHSV